MSSSLGQSVTVIFLPPVSASKTRLYLSSDGTGVRECLLKLAEPEPGILIENYKCIYIRMSL